VARDGKPIFAKAYGLANKDQQIPNQLDTKFALGSMNKMITSVAIAQLVPAGKFKYSGTVAQLLPGYPNQEIAAKITVHQLATHTSGLGDVFGPEFQQKKDTLRTVRDWFPLFAGKPLRFEPGKSWSYSNAGFVVLV
jgi:CubicO group peptidase (beta-lactamase class C family)